MSLPLLLACLKDAHAEIQTRTTARRYSIDIKLWRLDGHTCTSTIMIHFALEHESI